MQTYIDGRAFRHTARCDCGWDGKTRWSRASALIDVGTHAVDTGHYPVTTPLPVTSAEPVLVLKAS
ncbi:MAG: hypothetical protein U1C73_21280 [Dietzia sp.]|nr:hypothetical protein [Dietzia sp.]